MVRWFALAGIFGTVLAVAGCGFHLRGLGAAHVALDSINVTASNAHGEMQRALEQAFTEAGVKLVPPGQSAYSVHLLRESNTRRSVATTSDVRVAEYGLKLEVEFELLSAAGKELIPPSGVSAERIYRFDNTSFTGSSEEEKLLNQEMRRDVASQIIRRVDATVRAGKGKQS